MKIQEAGFRPFWEQYLKIFKHQAWRMVSNSLRMAFQTALAW
jgi:hypothetical protein